MIKKSAAFRLLFILPFLFLLHSSLFAQTETLKLCNCANTSKWNLDLSLSAVVGGKLVNAVKDYGLPISLGLSENRAKNAFFPFGQMIRFSYFRESESTSHADFYMMAWGLTFDRWWDLTFYLGYEILLAIFKERIAANELAITFHDLYLSPFLGVRKVFYDHGSFNFWAFGAVHVPMHDIKEGFLEIGVGGSIPL